MTLSKPANHLTRHYVESRVQTRGSVTLVIVRATFDLTWAQRQHRLSAIQRLNLSFLVHRQHQSVIRRVQIELDHIDHLIDEMGVLLILKVFRR